VGTGTQTLGKCLQVGVESAWGTAALAQTYKLPGITSGMLDFDATMVHPAEYGRIGPSPLIANTYLDGKATFGGECLPGVIDYFLNGMMTPPTPSGTPGTYVWAWAPPTGGTAAVPVPQTWAHGNLGVQGYQLVGGLVGKITISWTAGDTWKFSSDLLGKQIQAATPTAALADNAPALLSGAVYASDTWAGTMGATLVPAVLYGFQLDIENGLHMKQFGTAAPEGWGHNAWKTTLRLDVEYSAATQANMINPIIGAGLVGQRQHSIKATAGTTSLEIQHAGTEVGYPQLWPDRNGNRVISATFEGTYNTSFAQYLKVISTFGVNVLA
jgi:hypothetical protein